MSEENETNTTAEAPTFGLQDLVFVLQIVEACASRGAFRADELANVGGVYDRLRNFLISSGAIPNPAAATVQTNQGDE